MSWGQALATWTNDYALDEIELGMRAAVHVTLDEAWKLRNDDPGPRWVNRVKAQLALAKRNQGKWGMR